MSRGRTERPVSSALRRNANFVLWFRVARRDGIDACEARTVERFLACNLRDLEKIDTNELGAIQVLTSGEINRNLRGRVERNEAADVDEWVDMLGEG